MEARFGCPFLASSTLFLHKTTHIAHHQKRIENIFPMKQKLFFKFQLWGVTGPQNYYQVSQIQYIFLYNSLFSNVQSALAVIFECVLEIVNFLRKKMKIFDFGGQGPQKTVFLKQSFVYISKNTGHRNKCNTSLEAYFAYLTI